MKWNTQMKMLILPTLLLLTACATVSETAAPDGRKAYALNCSGAARGWDKCLKAAGDICGAKGYDVIDRSSESMAAFGGSSSGFGGSVSNDRSMMIACKK
jgi:hypothetical protein